jgi:hypothetical protein
MLCAIDRLWEDIYIYIYVILNTCHDVYPKGMYENELVPRGI